MVKDLQNNKLLFNSIFAEKADKSKSFSIISSMADEVEDEHESIFVNETKKNRQHFSSLIDAKNWAWRYHLSMHCSNLQMKGLNETAGIL